MRGRRLFGEKKFIPEIQRIFGIAAKGKDFEQVLEALLQIRFCKEFLGSSFFGDAVIKTSMRSQKMN